MGRINVLGFDVANLIAAGEVVDRPSSVVKELLENSIDAGASAVTVEIQRGGVSFIRISDDGCGMEPEDLPVAILRHATSKISKADDLGSIATLGFRGEALAAISSVSKIRIFSKPRDAQMGSLLTAEGGDVLDITEIGCADGTTVVVEDLFFNVPARRKFLKKDATEAAAVGAVVERIALSRPDISVKYICDGELKFVTAGDGKLYSAIYAVFGKATAARMLEVSRSADGITVKGYVSEPDLFKSNRNMENFFVNGRYVKSKTAMAAVEQAFRTRIPQDKFPICVLNIEINPAAVDVNVHPAKLEIKFTNERLIFDAVYYAVLNALEASVVRPELSLSSRRGAPVQSAQPQKYTPVSDAVFSDALPPRENVQSAQHARAQVPTTSQSSVRENSYAAQRPSTAPYSSYENKDQTSAPAKPRRDNSFWIDGAEAKKLLGAFVPADARGVKPEQVKLQIEDRPSHVSEAPKAPLAEEQSAQSKVISNTLKTFAENKAESKEIKANAEDEVAEIPEYIILGEAYNCYVIVQLEDRLVFVDKHAAHERIIFDELCRRMKNVEMNGQMLLAPLTVELLEIEGNAVEEYKEKILSLGFGFSLAANGAGVTVTIDRIPEVLSTNEALELFQTLASRLTDVGAGLEAAAEEFFSARLFQASCKAAVKGGRIYDVAHIRWICDRLFIKEDGKSVIRTCPHGRPVAFEVKKSSIDKQFARLG